MSALGRLIARMHDALHRGDMTTASSIAQAAIDLDPQAREPRLLLSEIAQRAQQWAVAADHLGALADDPIVAARLATVLVRMGRYAESVEPYVYAAGNGADPLGSLLRLSWVYERLNQFEAMHETLERARTLAGAAGVDLTIRAAVLGARTPEWRESLEVLENVHDLAGEDKLARGRLRDKAGRYSDAWSDFVSGKRYLARTSGQRYPHAAVAAHFEQLRRGLTAEFLKDAICPAEGAASNGPVFIAGPPRSGTTLLETRLASSELTARGELPGVFAMTQRAATTAGGYPTGLTALSQDSLKVLGADMARDYLASADAAVGSAASARFIDKMPFNEQHLPLIAMAFPQAPLIAMSRHPLDVIVSMMSHHMTHGHGCAFDPVSAATHIAAVDDLTEHWSAAGLGFTRQRYEDLVADPVHSTARLAEMIGVATGDASSDMRTAATPSYAQVHQDVHDKAVERWRNYAPFLAELVPIVSDLAQRRGYQLPSG